MPQTIDIIIPVYNAYDDLQRCVDSVLRCTAASHRLILIDDCSPDSRIGEYFEKLCAPADSRLTLLRNEANLGFVGTVNRGMALSKNDVVLLNSDTIVTQDWMEKLCRCAASDARIGTITPFSNNAEICSFPLFCRDNALPEGLTAEDMNRALEAAAVPVYPNIPTAVGFCMFIRRALLEEIGLFDAETFRLGYGEENDFCMRAAAAGWRNVLCDDTFVQHVGNRSFDTKKKALAEENMKRLLAKHPDYLRQVMAFIEGDPIKPIRHLGQSFLAFTGANGSKPGVLHIMHGHGGGTEQHIRDLMHGNDRHCRHYMLITTEDVWLLKDANGDEALTYQFTLQENESWADLLGGLCASFHVALCHVHHLSGCRAGLLEAFSGSGLRYGFSVHDFFLACPTINLLDDTGVFCGGETDPARCQSCLNAQPDYQSIDIAAWRAAHAAFIARASFVIAPSRWAAQQFQRYFPRDDIRVIPHGVHAGTAPIGALPTARLLPRDDRVSIGVLGAIGPVKGARKLESLVTRSRERGLSLRWVVIGYLDRQFEAHQDADTLFTVHGKYRPEHVEALLDHYGVDLVLFPSAGPETYCYTLSETWLAGRPVLVPPIGALHERVQSAGAGWSMTDWRNTDAILDDVISILQAENRADFERKQQQVHAMQIALAPAMANTTELVYREILAMPLATESGLRPTAIAAAPMSNARLILALQAALGFPSEPAHEPEPAPEFEMPAAVETSIAPPPPEIAVRFRSTMLGAFLYRVIPPRWKQILKQRLPAKTS